MKSAPSTASAADSQKVILSGFPFSAKPSLSRVGHAVSIYAFTDLSLSAAGSYKDTDLPDARNRAAQLAPMTPPPRQDVCEKVIKIIPD